MGYSNEIKIALLDGCDFVELEVKLNFHAYDGHAALSLSGGEEGILKLLNLLF